MRKQNSNQEQEGNAKSNTYLICFQLVMNIVTVLPWICMKFTCGKNIISNMLHKNSTGHICYEQYHGNSVTICYNQMKTNKIWRYRTKNEE